MNALRERQGQREGRPQGKPATMADYVPSGPILAADIGSVHTRAVLLDVVDGKYRLISRAQALSTEAPPVGDVTVGLRRALQQLGAQSGRQFFDYGGNYLIGDMRNRAAERLVATASGGAPMKVVLVGLMGDVSIRSGQRALASTYAELVDTLSVVDVRTKDEQLNAILRGAPDLIFIVGGTDGGATEPMLDLLRTVHLAALLAAGRKPAVLYSGNEELAPTVREMFADEGNSLYITQNVRPTLLGEQLDPVQLELGLLYGDYRSAGRGDFREIQRLSKMGVMPTAQSFGNIVRYLGELPGPGLGVMCIDVGASTVTVTANVRHELHVTIRPDLGLGSSAVAGVQSVGVDAIQRWLSFKASEGEIYDYAWNKTLRPSGIPQTPRDLELEYAIAREMIRSAVASSRQGWNLQGRPGLLPNIQRIIGAGSVLAELINPGISALLMLDALQPVGVTEFQLDPYGLIPALGTAAYADPLAAVQVLELGGLTDLATTVSPSGRPRSGTAMHVSVKYGSGRVIEADIPGGTLRAVPLAAGQKAQVTIRLGRGLSLNGRRRVTLNVSGSAAGLIFDARGRPLELPREPEKRAARLPAWYAAVQGRGEGQG